MKGYTGIPYAREAAEIMERPKPYKVDFSDKDLIYCMRVAHFEARYNTINTLLADLSIKNILELSSGFSFRGLVATNQPGIHFIDTDLPELIEKKKELIAELTAGEEPNAGRFEILPLNALDQQALLETANRFEEGPIAIINEGLLLYLGTDEKKSLCSTIRQILVTYGGYWITADIYKKNHPFATEYTRDDKFQSFLDQHRIEDNKFENFEQAEAFFRENGLGIDKEADPDYSNLPVIQIALAKATEEQLKGIQGAGKFNTTWRLKPI
jgi:O-methyltransferase involved in polyketide biosynthesis